MTFTLKIKLGNDAMRLGTHVALALRETANKIDRGTNLRGVSGSISDENGNTVGSFKAGVR